jgi:hypothetical protein
MGGRLSVEYDGQDGRRRSNALVRAGWALLYPFADALRLKSSWMNIA